MVYGTYNELVFMGFINHLTSRLGAPHCMFDDTGGYLSLDRDFLQIFNSSTSANDCLNESSHGSKPCCLGLHLNRLALNAYFNPLAW